MLVSSLLTQYWSACSLLNTGQLALYSILVSLLFILVSLLFTLYWSACSLLYTGQLALYSILVSLLFTLYWSALSLLYRGWLNSPYSILVNSLILTPYWLTQTTVLAAWKTFLVLLALSQEYQTVLEYSSSQHGNSLLECRWRYTVQQKEKENKPAIFAVPNKPALFLSPHFLKLLPFRHGCWCVNK